MPEANPSPAPLTSLACSSSLHRAWLAWNETISQTHSLRGPPRPPDNDYMQYAVLMCSYAPSNQETLQIVVGQNERDVGIVERCALFGCTMGTKKVEGPTHPPGPPGEGDASSAVRRAEQGSGRDVIEAAAHLGLVGCSWGRLCWMSPKPLARFSVVAAGCCISDCAGCSLSLGHPLLLPFFSPSPLFRTTQLLVALLSLTTKTRSPLVPVHSLQA